MRTPKILATVRAQGRILRDMATHAPQRAPLSQGADGLPCPITHPPYRTLTQHPSSSPYHQLPLPLGVRTGQGGGTGVLVRGVLGTPTCTWYSHNQGTWYSCIRYKGRAPHARKEGIAPSSCIPIRPPASRLATGGNESPCHPWGLAIRTRRPRPLYV
jgi:hypothetical protein